VHTPEQRAAFARLEYLIDHQISVLPASALCAYDVAELGAAAVAELACLHPYTSTGATLFRLYAEPGAECALDGMGAGPHRTATRSGLRVDRVVPWPCRP